MTLDINGSIVRYICTITQLYTLSPTPSGKQVEIWLLFSPLPQRNSDPHVTLNIQIMTIAHSRPCRVMNLKVKIPERLASN